MMEVGALMVWMESRLAGLSVHLPLIFPTLHKIQNADRFPHHVSGVSGVNVSSGTISRFVPFLIFQFFVQRAVKGGVFSK